MLALNRVCSTLLDRMHWPDFLLYSMKKFWKARMLLQFILEVS